MRITTGTPLNAAAIDALIDAQTPEGLELDFKRDLPSDQEGAKFEIRADAAAFANASGGMILFGVEEDSATGCAHSVNGVDAAQLDKTISRLTQVLRSRIEPPLPSFEFEDVPLSTGRHVLALRVGKSWLAPHLVEKNDESYVMQVRVGRSKVRFGESEIRRAYERSGDLTAKIRRWKEERLAAILAMDTPASLPKGPLLVLHAVPMSGFANPIQLSATELLLHRELLEPLGSGYRGDARVNVDGVVTGSEHSYTQQFRNVAIESVCGRFTSEQSGRLVIASMLYEEAVVRALDYYAELLERSSVEYPVLVFLTLLNARGLTMAVPRQFLVHHVHAIDRDVVRLPEVLLDRRPVDSAAALRPSFDAAWNACGFPISLNYKDDVWIGRRSQVPSKGGAI